MSGLGFEGQAQSVLMHLSMPGKRKNRAFDHWPVLPARIPLELFGSLLNPGDGSELQQALSPGISVDYSGGCLTGLGQEKFWEITTDELHENLSWGTRSPDWCRCDRPNDSSPIHWYNCRPDLHGRGRPTARAGLSGSYYCNFQSAWPVF